LENSLSPSFPKIPKSGKKREEKMRAASNDVVFSIASMLDARSLVRFSNIDQRTNRVIDQHQTIWRSLWCARYTNKRLELLVSSDTPRLAFARAWEFDQSQHTIARHEIIRQRAHNDKEQRLGLVQMAIAFVRDYAWPCAWTLAWVISAWLCYTNNTLSWQTLWVLYVSTVCNFLVEITTARRSLMPIYFFRSFAKCVFKCYLMMWIASPAWFPLWLVSLPLCAEHWLQGHDQHGLLSRAMSYCAVVALIGWIGSWSLDSIRLFTAVDIVFIQVGDYMYNPTYKPTLSLALLWCAWSMVMYPDYWIMYSSAALGVYSLFRLAGTVVQLNGNVARGRVYWFRYHVGKLSSASYLRGDDLPRMIS